MGATQRVGGGTTAGAPRRPCARPVRRNQDRPRRLPAAGTALRGRGRRESLHADDSTTGTLRSAARGDYHSCRLATNTKNRCPRDAKEALWVSSRARNRPCAYSQERLDWCSLDVRGAEPASVVWHAKGSTTPRHHSVVILKTFGDFPTHPTRRIISIWDVMVRSRLLDYM